VCQLRLNDSLIKLFIPEWTLCLVWKPVLLDVGAKGGFQTMNMNWLSRRFVPVAVNPTNPCNNKWGEDGIYLQLKIIRQRESREQKPLAYARIRPDRPVPLHLVKCRRLLTCLPISSLSFVFTNPTSPWREVKVWFTDDCILYKHNVGGWRWSLWMGGAISVNLLLFFVSCTSITQSEFIIRLARARGLTAVIL